MSYEPTNWQNLPSTTTPIIAEKLNNIEVGIKENDTSIGKDVYDNTKTYAVGDYCTYQNELYVCTTPITDPAGDFDNTKWVKTNIIEKLQSQKKDIEALQNYSTTDTIVGKWIDGKPIYAISYAGTKTSGSDVWKTLDATDVKKIITFYGNLEAVSGNTKINYPLTSYENSSVYHVTSCNITNTNKIQIHIKGSTSNYDNGNFNITILYTKTTD